MTTVWVVTIGEYSDYRVVSVCSSEENAEAFISSKLGDGYFDVKLDIYADKAKQGLQVFLVDMRRDGRVMGSVAEMGLHFEDDRKVDFSGYDYVKNRGEGYRFYMWAKSKTHAIKIANERRTRMIAEGTWPGQPNKNAPSSPDDEA